MSLTIKQTLVAAGTAVLTLCAVSAGAVFMSSLHAARAQDAAAERFQSYLLADELRQSSDDLTRLARSFVVSGGEAKWEKQYFEILDIRNGKQPRPEAYERIYWDFKAADQEQVRPSTQAAPLLDLMKRAGFSAAELAKLEEAKANSDGLIKTETIAMNLAKGLNGDGTPGDKAELDANRAKARAMMHDLTYHQNKAKIMKPVDEFFVLLDQRTAAAVAAAKADATRWSQASLVAAVLLVASMLGALTMLNRRVSGLLHTVSAFAGGIADGQVNQSIDLHSGGEEGQILLSLQRMQRRLAEVISSIRGTADTVAQAGAQIEQGNQNLANRTEQQASSLQQTASSMEELGTTVKQNADNAHQANQLALTASSVATRGGQEVGQVVETMKDINDSSRKIADIITVIDGIAFQTNILALNAAVEAARAGEQGRGFAVVASEVRNLAQRSAGAAKEIKSLITASVERVQRGTELVDQAGNTMEEVVSSITRVTTIMGDISNASEQQRAGVAQMGSAVAQMDQVTQQNAALVEQSVAAARGLNEQSRQLVQAVSVFELA